MASSDILIEIDTIKGESKAKDDMIDLDSFSWGVTNSGSMSQGGGGGTGKFNFSDLTCTTYASKASPALMLNCANGTHIASATLHVRKAGGTAKEFYTVKLENILISSYQSSGHNGGMVPSDSFSLNFAKIHFETKVQNDKGDMEAGGDAKFDLKTGKS